MNKRLYFDDSVIKIQSFYVYDEPGIYMCMQENLKPANVYH